MTNANLVEILKRLMVVGSAATGYLMCDFADMHEYIEELLERPVLTHEMGSRSFSANVRDRSHADFVAAIIAARAALDEAT